MLMVQGANFGAGIVGGSQLSRYDQMYELLDVDKSARTTNETMKSVSTNRVDCFPETYSVCQSQELQEIVALRM